MLDETPKRALLVGIDEYTYMPPLHGCVNDVEALFPLLEKHANKERNFNCIGLRSGGRNRIDANALLSALDTLLAPGVDVALFYFAGHGMQSTNDVRLVTQETQSANTGTPLSIVLDKVQNSPIPSIIIILDCCFSGAAGGVSHMKGGVVALREGLTILTASRGDQPAAESISGRGLFSSLLCAALEGGAADVMGKVTLAGVYAYLAESFNSWQQRPTFKANIQDLRTLRACVPAMKRDELREVVELFEDPKFEYPLDPTYEPTHPSQIPEHVRVFGLLQ